MLQRFSRVIVAAGVLCAAASAHTERPMQIALTGLYEWESQITPGVDWWGIFPDEKDGYTLRPTRVSAVLDPSMVIEPEKAPRQISVPGKHGGVIVIRGLRAAAPGPLSTVTLDAYPRPVAVGKPYELSREGDTPATRFRLIAAGRPVGDETGEYFVRSVEDYELWLQRGTGEDAILQLLFKESEALAGEHARLRWVGDIDRDGQLDYVFNLGEHHTQTRLALYLSSAAKPGKLVGLVATWNGTCGC